MKDEKKENEIEISLSYKTDNGLQFKLNKLPNINDKITDSITFDVSLHGMKLKLTLQSIHSLQEHLKEHIANSLSALLNELANTRVL